ncbi:MAG TPA: type II secretion system F family protein [Verrucomicrobiota bacterium]|nr:type II secretion system F family protein [Verrucomicrobiota bacterium]HNU51441.1 type II secretion system F family protein [Verrucomicrobiota bacterium]
MPWIITPGQLVRQAEFYHQLAAMMAAGIPVVQALQQTAKAPPGPGFRRPLQALLGGLGQGMTFAEAASQVAGWLPAFDLALVKAGEESGRLDASCRLLSEYYQSRAQLTRQVLSDLAYPVVIVHAAVLLAPFPQLFLSGNVGAYARQTLGVLLPFYAVGLFLAIAVQGRRGERWRALLEAVLHPVPMLGKARRFLGLARLSAALGALLNAGVSILTSWPMAAASSGSPALWRAVRGWEPELQKGTPPGDLLVRAPVFPELFTNLYRTGEISGTLEDALRRLHTYYQDEATRRLRAFATWLPRLIYFGILIYLAFRIVGFWAGYYEGILNMDL